MTELAVIENAPPAEWTAMLNREHAMVLSGMHSALEHAAKCGKLLLDLKVAMPHEWKPWLAENFEASERTAYRYIEIAQCYDQDSTVLAEVDEHQEPTMSAMLRSIQRQLDGPKISYDENHGRNGETTEKTFPLTIAQLTSLARKRWHRPPQENDVLGWLKDAGLA